MEGVHEEFRLPHTANKPGESGAARGQGNPAGRQRGALPQGKEDALCAPLSAPKALVLAQKSLVVLEP